MPELFGYMTSGEPVYRLLLDNGQLRVHVLTFGAVLQSIEAASHTGDRANVVLGLVTLDDYVALSPHLGAVPGRYAGRIDHGRFRLDGVDYQLNVNAPPHTLHGGFRGFGKQNWTLVSHDAVHVEMTLVSPDGEEGFPATVRAAVRYTLEGCNLRISYQAETDRPTIINLTNHSYFNLAGEGSGDIFGHLLTLESDVYLPIRPDGIPTGEAATVEHTPFDFRTPCAIGARLRQADPQLQRALGYDHGFLVRGDGLRRAAYLHEPVSGRTLTVHATEPVIHVYSGNNLTGSLAGPSGRIYRSGDAICFEAEHPQDAPNHPSFSSTVLRPGSPFTATTVFEFGVVATDGRSQEARR